MAGSATTELIVKLTTPGAEKLPGLGRAFSQFGRDVNKAGLNVKQLSSELKQQESTNLKSINNTKALANSWKELAASVEFGSKEFKEATAEAKRLDAELQKMQGRKMGGMGRIARTAGAVAGAGVFGGPEGAIGAAIGGFMPGGGPISAAVGGAIGAQVGMVRQAIGSTAEYSAALARQRKALKLVIGDTNTYAKSQEFLSQTSKDLAIPQDVITRQFTALTASVKGAGHSVEDAEKVFESIASGIRGTGGSLEDMKAAMTATAQVFSKGKVSAEELRQQLGERLPGAFTIFAESMGKTPAELDKALEGGKVTLDDFMKFSQTLFERYGENAKILAAGPEAAGDRLATAMSELKDNIGELLTPIGANFQDTFTDIINAINPAIKKLVEFQKTLRIASIKNEIQRLEEILESGRIRLNSMSKRTVDVNRNFDITKGPLKTPLMLIEEELESKKQILAEINGELTEVKKNTKDLEKTGKEVYEGLTAGVTKYLNGIKSLGEEIADAVSNAIKGLEDAIVDFVKTGKLSFESLITSILEDLTRLHIRQNITNPLFNALSSALGGGSGGGGNALSGASFPSDVGGLSFSDAMNLPPIKYASGGYVNRPTYAMLAEGGESELVIPQSKLASAMARYQAGARGADIVPGGNNANGGGGSGYAGGGNVTVNYQGDILRFNNEDYVRQSDVGGIINAAANAGESRTMKTLKNSRSQRAMVGL